ncbi:MAG: sigma 54 modulation/S30EA ribosomal C-terminal domain-containing protein, partial [Proteobacteria bacterium]|nr:sigma 54 modulation/S30EA ribosomal C-terminal domain-containing protein [Pseudomonadota bacterium]
RYREKLKNVGRSNRKGNEQQFKVDVFEAESFTEAEPNVVHTHKLTAKPMDVDEAAMQLDLSQDDFLVFINARTDAMNVIYRRGDGDFGLIEPQ